MSLLKRAAAGLLIAVLLVAALPATVLAAPSPLAMSAAEQVTGLYVATGAGQDFPVSTNLSKAQQKTELDSILAFAKKIGFNTIYFEVINEAGAFYNSKNYPYSEALSGKKSGISLDLNRLDPLDYLTKEATKQNLRVVAVLDPFLVSKTGTLPQNKKNTATKNSEYVRSANGKLFWNPDEKFTQDLLLSTVKELVGGYNLSGVLLKNFAYPAQDFDLRTTEQEKTELLRELLTQIRQLTQGAKNTVTLGMGTDYDAQTYGTDAFYGYANPIAFAAEGLLDFIVPTLAATVDSGSYERELTDWLDTGAAIYTGNDATRLLLPVADACGSYENPLELDLQLYSNNQLGARGCVINRYSALRQDFFDISAHLAACFAPQESITNTAPLSLPKAFQLTRPTQDITTSYTTYYLMGTCEGTQPVTLNGTEIATTAPGNLFGVQVNLKLGQNTFTLAQGGSSESVTITRYDPATVAPRKITAMQQSSIFPAYGEGVRVGEAFTLSCIAPSGAAVSAQLEGRYITLEQTANAAPGVPAVFSAQATLTGSYAATETVALGKLSYAMNYNGENHFYTSDNVLFAMGRDAKFAVEVTDMRGDTSSVAVPASFRKKMITSVEQGAQDYVIGSSGNYYKLSCGGYVHKEDVQVLEGDGVIDTVLDGKNSTYEVDAVGRTLTLPATGAPYYISQYLEDSVRITFYNTKIDPSVAKPLPSEDDLLSSAVWEYNAESNTSVLTLTSRGGKRLWGYNVEFAPGKLLVRIKNTPKLSANSAKPLEGITVIVDAGHGGNDPGALGVTGMTGPDERDLNYLNASAACIRLKQMGATVFMTQTKNERLSYAQRMDIARDERADFYLSFHLNSTAESVDSTNVQGVEIYYNEELAIPFGNAIATEVCKATRRNNRGVLPATFRVTQMTNAPSLLCELGYMVSPAEYESLCKPLNIYKSALGISNGIVRAIREANP